MLHTYVYRVCTLSTAAFVHHNSPWQLRCSG